jgi:hypothetical protein
VTDIFLEFRAVGSIGVILGTIEIGVKGSQRVDFPRMIKGANGEQLGLHKLNEPRREASTCGGPCVGLHKASYWWQRDPSRLILTTQSFLG